MDDQTPAKPTIYVQFSESGTIRKWAEYPFDGGDRPLWPDEPGTTISMLDPATIIAQHVVTPAPE